MDSDFVRGGPTLDVFFFLLFFIDKGVGGQRIQITLKMGHHGPTSERRFAGGPKMVQLLMLAWKLWFSRGSGPRGGGGYSDIFIHT